MHQTAIQAAVTILVIAAVTLLLRSLPFLFFSDKKPVPKLISYFGKVLPFAVIGMLVVYCFKDVTILSGSHGLPELIAVIAIFILHKWKHTLLLSVGGGTLIYMMLVQLVFI